MTPDEQLTAWSGIAPALGWLCAMLMAGLAAAIATCPSLGVLHDTARYQAWTAGRRWVMAAIAAGLLLHIAGFFGSFNVYDDYRFIIDQPLVTRLSLQNLQTLAVSHYLGTNEGLAFIVAALNWALAGKTYWVWYLFNWLSLIPVLYLVARLTWHLTGCTQRAALAALLFAATPVVAESLSWMSARGGWLGLTFALASCVAYLEYRWLAARHNPRWYALSVVLFGISLLSSSSFAFLPLWLVCFDLWDRRRDWPVIIAEKLPFLAVALWSMYYVLAYRNRNLEPLGGDYFRTFLTDLNLLVEYLRALFLPFPTGVAPPLNLASDWLTMRSFSTIMSANFAPLAALLMLGGLCAMTIAVKRRHHWSLPAFCGMAIVVSLLPAMNFPSQGFARAFEYRYSLAAHVIAAILLADLAIRLWQNRTVPLLHTALSGAAIVYLLWACAATIITGHLWRDSLRYWHWSTTQYPANYLSHYFAGKAAQSAQQHELAVSYLKDAVKFRGADEFAAYRRLGDSLYRLGDQQGAKKYWRIYYREFPEEITNTLRQRFKEIGLELPAG
jgi:hypothetical protein